MKKFSFKDGWVRLGDCIKGLKKVAPESVDLIFADPPFGINFNTKVKQTYGSKSKTLDGYCEISPKDYPKFSRAWVEAALPTLRDGGCFWIMSGWTHTWVLEQVMHEMGLKIINKLVWKYEFGVYTTRKFVTSHFDMLYVLKGREKNRTFNRAFTATKVHGKNLDYAMRQDVWPIKKERHPGVETFANKLPDQLVRRVLRYTTNPGDLVLDPFLGNGTTIMQALALNRRAMGFELNPKAYEFVKRSIRSFNAPQVSPS